MKWEWYKDSNTFRVFLHLILRANWKPGKYKGRQILRGQTFTSYRSLSEELNLSTQEIRTAFAHLESTGEVTRKKYPDGLIITVKNYDRYQQSNTPSNTTFNTLSTGEQHAINNDRRNIKNNKELNKNAAPSESPKKEPAPLTDEEWEAMSDEEWMRAMDDGTV